MSFELGLKILLALYVVVALAMIGLILLQRGQGAQAGSGFGSGASATVFGSRGSANFLSISTKWLAVLFFALSIGMGVYISRNSKAVPGATDLGVMGQADAAAGDAKAPVTGSPEVPVAPAAASDVPTAAADASVPAASADVEVPKAEVEGETKPVESSN
ncbi:MAG: preprotein translocase subunit SecG [Xanthomonadales bacterium]|nr:preprotein translocase subunit SecG [Xanthomonadales bacterium]